MKLKLFIFLMLSFASTFSLAATDIGLGTLKGVKVYNFGTNKAVRVYFNDDVIHENTACQKTATVAITAANQEFVDRFLSVATAAYVSGKAVRITS